MTRENAKAGPDLSWHMYFLGNIYAFLGWLGLLGGVVLLLTFITPDGSAQADVNSSSGISQAASAFFLVVWSVLLLHFSRDIKGARTWSTGLGGMCIGIFSLISIPIGTAVGTYTLWIIFHHRRLSKMLAGRR